MLLSDFKQALYTLIDALTDYDVIYNNQNAPRPSSNYISLFILTNNMLGYKEHISTNSSGIRTMINRYTASVSIQAHGQDSYDELQTLERKLKSLTGIDTAETNNIVMRFSDDIQNITTLIDNRYEERAVLNAVFAYSDTYTEDVGFIETVNAEVNT